MGMSGKKRVMELHSSFEIVVVNDTCIVVTDMKIGRSITDDADNVIRCLHEIVGGIGLRAVYYRDSVLRYDRLLVKNGVFQNFQSCTYRQQEYFSKLASSAPALWTVYGIDGAVRIVGSATTRSKKTK